MGPIVVNVVGLKKSGKTTVVEAIVAELRRMGYNVATIKSMVHSTISLDVEGKDTWRHGRAGADMVISLSKGETVLIERHEGLKRDLKGLERLIPDGTQFIVCEGLEDTAAPQLQVCCIRRMEDLEETRRVRGLVEGSIIAISGLAASTDATHPKLKVFDVMDPHHRGQLIKLILDRSGGPAPKGEPGGPLLYDAGWRPGILPPGVFPEVPEDMKGGHT